MPRLMPGKLLRRSGGGRNLGTEFGDGGVKLQLLQDRDYIKTLVY